MKSRERIDKTSIQIPWHRSNFDFCEKKGVLEQTVSSLFEHVLFSLQWQDKILFTLFTTAHLSPLRRHCDIVYLRELYSE